jgi:polysaccharide biosynthesis/export protein
VRALPSQPCLRSSIATALVVVVALLVLFPDLTGQPVAPVGAQATQEYILGPGDTVDVTVFGEADLTRTVIVRPDGKFNLPLIGDVEATGVTPAQLSARIADKLKTYIRVPQVSVSVRQFRPESRSLVYLVGQVGRPGPVEIQSGWTLIEVMAAGGGLGPRAAGRRATLIRRGNNQSVAVDLDRLLIKGDRAANVPVEPGDIVMVPTLQNRVLVLGAIRNPGAYDLEEGARVLEVLAIAGGPLERAKQTEIGVVRHDSAGKAAVTTVDVTKIVRGGAQNVQLQHADIVYVPEGRIVWRDVLGWLSGLNVVRVLLGGW